METPLLADTVIVTARSYRSLGRYAAAVEALQTAPSALNHPRLVLALADTWFAQGYVKNAHELLESLDLPTGPTDDHVTTALQILRGYLRFQVSAKFRDELQSATCVIRSTFNGTGNSQPTEALLCADLFYCSFVETTKICASLDDLDTAFDDSIRRINAAFNHFVSVSDRHNALRAAKCFYLLNNKDATLLWQFKSSCCSSMDLHYAETLYFLAQTLQSSETEEQRDHFFKTAFDAYREAGHAHRPLDIRIKQTCRKALLAGGVTGNTIIDLVQEYESIDYPVGRVDMFVELSAIPQRNHDYPSQTKIVIEIEKAAKLTGSFMTWVISRFGNLARYAGTMQYSGQLIRSGAALWNDLIGSDCSKIRGTTAKMVAEAYFSLKAPEETREWSTKAEQDHDNLITGLIPTLPLFNPSQNTHQLEQMYHDAAVQVERDLSHGRIENAVHTCEDLTNLLLTRVMTGDSYFKVLDDALDLAASTIDLLPNRRTQTKNRAFLSKSRAAAFLRKGTSRADVTCEDEALRILVDTENSYLSIELYAEAAMMLQQQALVNISKFQKLLDQDRDLARAALENALSLYSTTLDRAERLGLLSISRDNAYWVAYCCYRLWQNGWATAEQVLVSLRSAERFVDTHRHEMSAQRRLEAAHTKRLIQADPHHRNIYSMAMSVCDRHGWLEEFWLWVQKSKARSLSDLLGLGIFVPRALEDRIMSEALPAQLYEAERSLLDADAEATDADQLPIRDSLQTIRAEMRLQPILQELLNLREGTPLTFQELREVSSTVNSSFNHRVVYVEWFIDGNTIFQVIVDAQHQIIVRRLAITIGEVNDWVSRYLSHDQRGSDDNADQPLSGIHEDDDEASPLRLLDPLVSNLEELSDRDDLLILCPSSVLHRLPIHALHVGNSEDEQVLIDRNLIVYAASLTSFAQSCAKASHVEGSSDTRKSTFLAVYENSDPSTELDTDFDETAQEMLYSTTAALASDFSGQSFTSDQVTQERLRQSLQTSSFVHFLGHCDFDNPQMSQQSLQLFQRGGNDSCNIVPLSVKDIFDFRISAQFVSIIGCGTASQHFQAGDEPLGLVTAFLAAGACSVVGTLWPVQTSTASLFTVKFYSYLRLSGKRQSNFYDLAHAMREAVLDMRKVRSKRLPYHWASFVLHGSPFC